MTAEGIGLTDRTALELLDVLDRREASALEVVDAHIARIEVVDRVLNAIPTRTFERARDEARASDARRARREPLGPLEGLPVAFKDLQPTAGVRTTMGSRVLAEWIPEEDSLTVRRIREAGAIGLGKTNVPEFGAGSQTYNDVFGPTRNPWDPSRTPGGSSGGAAAALAARMLALADGSDYGGSLRNPASFCDVVGFRTTPGLIPTTSPATASASRSTVPWRGPFAMSRSCCRSWPLRSRSRSRTMSTSEAGASRSRRGSPVCRWSPT